MTKLVLVTGGARRIGAAICRDLARNGYDVLIHANTSISDAEALRDDISRKGIQRAGIVHADFSQPGGAAKFIRDVQSHSLITNRGGALDGLIHNASIYETSNLNSFKEFKENGTSTLSLENEILLLRRMMLIHMEIPYHITLGLANELRRAKGCVVALTDTSLGRAWPSRTAYTTSKAGLHQLMMNLAGDLSPEIRCNCVSPGAILHSEHVDESFDEVTNKALLKRPGTPQEIAAAVRFLLQNSYITGHDLVVDGGQSLHGAY
jgi:pteridine reductase